MNGAEARILTWLASLGLAPEAVIALRGDVSPRRYFRLVGVEAVVAVYPPEQAEQSSRFLETSRLFEASGVRVPRILQADTASGLLLLEDLGDVSLFDLGHRPWQSLSGWYREAIGIAEALGGCPAADFANINPPLDARRLETELVGAQEAFLGEPEFGGSLEEREAVELA